MSELIGAGRNRNAMRWQLLTTVSMLALLTFAWETGEAKAEGDDADRPTVWIELGGQLERQTGQGDVYTPPFLVNYPSSTAYMPISPLHTEKPPLFGNGGEAKLSFEPEGSDWVFSAAMRYGRANGSKSVYQNAPGKVVHRNQLYLSHPTPSSVLIRCCHVIPPYTNVNVNYADTKVTHQDSHTILDFQVGKEVGLGLFGRNSESVLSVGVRFAQFAAKSSATLHAKPDTVFYNGVPQRLLSKYPQMYYPYHHVHVFGGTAQSARNFHGLGPALSWNSSIALLGNAQSGEFSFDWGADAAVLFGRRKASGQHHESGHYRQQKYTLGNTGYYSHTAPFNRRKSVTVPNVGGFAGVSFKFPNAKVSLGYRGDFFFGAMDTGWDTQKSKTVGFYGPFASISFGIGG